MGERRFSFRHFLMMLSLAVAMMAGSAWAQEKPAAIQGSEGPFKLGVLNVEALLQESTAMKGLREQIKQQRDKLKAEFEKEEQKLRTAREELSRQRTILSPEAFSEAQKKFEADVADVQRRVQSSSAQMEKTHADGLKQVEKAINEVLQDLVKKHHLTLILRAETMAYFNPGLNITSVVLEGLNAKLPSLKAAAKSGGK